MSDTNANTIHNATLNFKFEERTSYRPNANEVVEWAKANILQVIDFHADNLTDPLSMVKIPELNIDLELQFEDGFLGNSDAVRAVIGDQIYSSLKKAIHHKKSLQVPLHQYKANIVLRYLKTGQLKNDSSLLDWDNLVSEFFSELFVNDIFMRKWLTIVQDQHAFVRFFRLGISDKINSLLTTLTSGFNATLNLTVLWELVHHNKKHFLFASPIDFYHTIFQGVFLTGQSFKMVLKRTLEIGLSQNSLSINELEIPSEHRQLLLEFLEEELLVKQPGSPPDGNETIKEERRIIEEGAQINQAGLVLLAPFLPKFLNELGFIGSKGQLLKKGEIPILLHFLATGESSAPEWQLVLPKILVGLGPEESCNTKIRKTKKLTTEVEALLRSAITHWEALKSTGSEALRETFLIRKGILKSKNGFYYLYVNEEAVDILLSYVPWNYSTIKLSWMQNILFVEWNKS